MGGDGSQRPCGAFIEQPSLQYLASGCQEAGGSLRHPIRGDLEASFILGFSDNPVSTDLLLNSSRYRQKKQTDWLLQPFSETGCRGHCCAYMMIGMTV